MVAKKSQLSPECRRFFRAGPEPSAATAAPVRPAGKPVNIRPATATKKATATTKKPKAKKAAKPAAT